jgi:hypothetical protein
MPWPAGAEVQLLIACRQARQKFARERLTTGSFWLSFEHRQQIVMTRTVGQKETEFHPHKRTCRSASSETKPKSKIESSNRIFVDYPPQIFGVNDEELETAGRGASILCNQ